MLLKLLKYNLKPIIKTATVFGISIIACALLLNMTSYDYVQTTEEYGYVNLVPDASQNQQFIHTGFYNLTILIGIVFILITILATWKNFHKSFYSDTAYLTHTLPVSRRTLWISQILTAIIANSILILILVVTCCVLQATPNGRGVADSFGWHYDAPFAYYPALIINMFMILNIVTLCGLAGTILGHRLRNNQHIFSIICSIILLLIIIIVIGWISDIWTGFSRNGFYINFLATTHYIGGFNNATYALTSIFGLILVSLGTLATLYLIGDKNLQKGINLE